MTYKEFKAKIVANSTEEYLRIMLENTQGNSTKAAVTANMDRANFLRLCRKFKVCPKQFREVKYEAT